MTIKRTRTKGGTDGLADRALQVWQRAGERETALDDAARALIGQALELAALAQREIDKRDRKIRRLETLATTDELTGLTNRRALEKALTQTLRDAARHDETGVLAYLDIDQFKQVNDTHGHSAGDALLVHIARFLTASVRGTDLVARIGGDEFAILMRRAEIVPAIARVRSIIEDLNKTVAEYHGIRIPVRASVGVEPFGPGSTAAGVLEAADKQMYANKRAEPSTAPLAGAHLRVVR